MNIGKRFLRCDLLRPGDVILSASSEKEGFWISVGSKQDLTGPSYSHAAIVLNRQAVFEAVDHGLVYRSLVLCRAGSIRGEGPRILLHDVSDFKEMTVLRHPALLRRDPYGLMDDVMESVGKHWALEYPERCELAKAVARFLPARWLSFLVLRAIDRWKQFRGETKPTVPGPFCSKLVTLVINDLSPKWPLFDPPRDPDSVSPNALRHDSCLEPIVDSITTDMPEFVERIGLAEQLNEATVIGYRKGAPLAEALELQLKNNKTLVAARRMTRQMGKTAMAISDEQQSSADDYIHLRKK